MSLGGAKLRVCYLQLAITSKLQELYYCKHHAHLRGKANYIDFLSQSQIYSTPLRFPKILAKNIGQQRVIMKDRNL